MPTANGFRVTINQRQHSTLRNNFRRAHKPYVFYAFSTYKTYQALDADFRSPNAPLFFANTLFVDLYDLPARCNSLIYDDQGDFYPSVKRQLQAPIVPISGDDLVEGLINCPIGLSRTQMDEMPTRLNSTITWRTRTPHLAVLFFTP